MNPSQPEHHTAIIVGGGPAGLALAVVLGGWHPHFRESPILRQRYPQLADFLARTRGTLLGMDFRSLAPQLAPVDLFRILHHPRQLFENLGQIAMEFRPGPALDYLLITQEEVGGVWNKVPQNLLTLSPGQWMELAFHPLAQHVEERSVDLDDVNDLILKRHLVDYYRAIPERFGQESRMRTNERVERIEPHEEGFMLTTRDVSGWHRRRQALGTRSAPVPQPFENPGGGQLRRYTCRYLVYAAGQRCILRRLGIPGEELPGVHCYYDRAEDFPGERVLVIGGGRSADWAATELHDAGRKVCYAMRQPRERHWRLIGDSRGGLPYYARIAEIMEGDRRRFEALYETRAAKFAPSGDAILATLAGNGSERRLEVDHVVKEIGGWPDYSVFQGFPPLRLFEKHDPYRFQVHQMRTHPHNYESIDVPDLYAGGYLAQDIGLVVIAMHGTTYAIAGDILQKERMIP